MGPSGLLWQGFPWSVCKSPVGARWSLNGGVLFLSLGSTVVRLNFHLNGAICTLALFYLTSPIVLVAFLSVFLIHSNKKWDKKTGLNTKCWYWWYREYIKLPILKNRINKSLVRRYIPTYNNIYNNSNFWKLRHMMFFASYIDLLKYDLRLLSD